MFTGIIEEVGYIQRIGGGQLAVSCEKVLTDVRQGDSIAVNGVCLTVTSFDRNYFTADVMPETIRCTEFRELKKGSPVNLERALTLASRLGGHIVSGHIDGTGTIESLQAEDNAVWVTIAAPGEILKYIVQKGSIAIDGVSLTVAYIDDSVFKVSIIPHTKDQTTLLGKKPGDEVNLECDMIGKYIEKLLVTRESPASQGIDLNFLSENGFA